MTAYGYLTPSEQTTFNECARLHQLADWSEFTDTQSARLAAADAWIRERRAYIYDIAEGNVPHENGPGWNTAHRRERYDYLHTCQMGAPPHAVCQLPTEGGMDFESVLISEREMWWVNPKGQYADQSARRQQCTDELIARRKYVWNLAEGNVDGATPGWDHANREQRYRNLQVATKYGSGYADWCETHNTTTGQPLESGGSAGSTGRDRALAWMADHRGCYESPDGSNCDSRSDGIRAAQDRCANGTWLRYQPWCGVWCWNAMHAGGVKNLDPNIASVEWIEAQARAGRPPFTGWTTNGGNARPGDLVCLFSPGQHVGMVVQINADTVTTDEGNTSDTSATRTRYRASDVVGYALVAYP